MSLVAVLVGCTPRTAHEHAAPKQNAGYVAVSLTQSAQRSCVDPASERFSIELRSFDGSTGVTLSSEQLLAGAAIRRELPTGLYSVASVHEPGPDGGAKLVATKLVTAPVLAVLAGRITAVEVQCVAGTLDVLARRG